MSSHRAPQRRRAPSLATWRLMVPAVLVTTLAVVSFTLLPREVEAETSSAGATPLSRATHDAPAASRSNVRTLRQDPARATAAQEAARGRRGEQMLEAREERVVADRKKVDKAVAREREANQPRVSAFRVGALNILGSQHTAGPGGYGPGTERAGISAGIIMARGVDVVALSEVQDDQLAVLNNRLAGYSIWPQHSLGRNGQRLQIAWRSSRFEMVDGGSVTYTFASQQIPKPYVLLRDRATGAEFWVISTHLSAGGLEGERDSGTAITISLIQRLQAETGKPVIVGGDVNEHEEFFYDVCRATGFLAANGGGPGCALPPRPLRVDWIMGGGGGGVDFSGYVQDGSTLARASDHYFIHGNVSVTDSGGSS